MSGMPTPIPEQDFLTKDKFLNTLAESYVLHETILNSTELSVISTQKDGIINSLNKAAERILGYDAEELIGKQTLTFAHVASELEARARELSREFKNKIQPGIESIVGSARKTRTTDRREWTYVRKNGTRFQVSLSISGIWDDRGELSGFLAIATDISEQKRADEELRRSRNHLHALIESLDDIVVEVDADARYLSLWTSREELLFHDKNDYVGRLMREVITPELAEKFETAVKRVLASKSPEFLEYASIVPGSDAWYVAKLTPLTSSTVLILIREITAQKKHELAVIESESRFRLLAENVPGVIYLCRDAEPFTNIFISANIEKITGYKVHEFLDGSIDIQQLIHPEDAEYVQKTFLTSLTEGKNFSLEYRIVHRSGQIRWVKESGGGLVGKNGQNLIEGYISDITDRKLGDIALKESEQRFRLLAENVPGVIYLCLNDIVLYVNEKVEQVTGYKASQYLSGEISYYDQMEPDEKTRVRNAIKEALAEGKSYHLDYKIKHRKGHWIWVEEVGGSPRDSQVKLREGYISDVTERKIAEAELRRVAAENYRIFNFSPCLQAVASFDGYYVKLNPIWERTLGWSLKELMDRKFTDFVHPDDVETSIAGGAQLAAGSSLLSFENRYRCKDGTYRWLLWTASPDIENRVINASAIDITERKKAEDQLRLSKANLETAALEMQQQNKQLNEFAHIISHNLRSPVGNIQALISLLSKESTIEEYQEVFHNLQRTAINLNETLNELLDILRVKKENTMERTSIRFEDVLTRTRQDLMGEILNTNATVTADFATCPTITYYKPYLESIMLNLLSNALKYRMPGRNPVIRFSTSNAGGRCVLRVTDNGLGIDMERFGHQLFGLRKVFHDHKEARGVGLFLTKTQVEAMGGKISAESKPNEGSTFIVEL